MRGSLSDIPPIRTFSIDFGLPDGDRAVLTVLTRSGGDFVTIQQMEFPDASINDETS